MSKIFDKMLGGVDYAGAWRAMEVAILQKKHWDRGDLMDLLWLCKAAFAESIVEKEVK